MTTETAIYGLDSGGQGWSTAIMQSQPDSLGELPETSNANAPCPEWVGEPVNSAKRRPAATPHKRMIAELVASDPDIHANGFWQAVRNLSASLDREDISGKGSFIPDAWKLDREGEWIEIHEVVCTNGISDRKALALGRFFGEWDSDGFDGWLPVLFIHREGYEPRREPLLPFYHNWLDWSVTQ